MEWKEKKKKKREKLKARLEVLRISPPSDLSMTSQKCNDVKNGLQSRYCTSVCVCISTYNTFLNFINTLPFTNLINERKNRRKKKHYRTKTPREYAFVDRLLL